MSFTAVIKSIKPGAMSFGSIHNTETKADTIEIRGVIASSLLEFNNINGGIDYALRVKVYEDELYQRLEKCEGLEVLRGYKYFPFIRDGMLTLKPKKDKNGSWKFHGDMPEEGDVVKATVQPGVYINSTDMVYGFFFKLVSF